MGSFFEVNNVHVVIWSVWQTWAHDILEEIIHYSHFKVLWPLTKLSIYCKIPLLSCEMNIMISGAFACVFAEFHFDRKFEYYLLQTYFPSMLVVMLSWVSFWIDPAAVPARISLGLLTVLTMTTQTSVLNSRLPRFIHKIILFFFTPLRRLITVCMSMLLRPCLDIEIFQAPLRACMGSSGSPGSLSTTSCRFTSHHFS